MFEKASRLKLRFETIRGNATAEDLWDLPLTSSDISLDNIAKSLNRTIKDSEEESFVIKQTGGDAITVLKLDIVKHVIKIKLEEAEARNREVEVKAKKERIMAILADKEDDDLKGKSAEELTGLLEDLG